MFTGCTTYEHVPYDLLETSKAFVFKRLNFALPGSPQMNLVKLSKEEISKFHLQPMPDTQAFYTFACKGFCPGKQYRLFNLKLNESLTEIGNGWIVDENGRLFSKIYNFLDENNIEFKYIMNGEESRFFLAPISGSQYVAAIVTPNPIETKWEDGAKLSVVSCAPSMQEFSMYGEGFKPNENLKVACIAENKTISIIPTVNEEGKWSRDSLFSFSDTGFAELVIERENSKELCVLEFAYGKEQTSKLVIEQKNAKQLIDTLLN